MDEATTAHWLSTLSDLRLAFNRAVELIVSSACVLSVVPVHHACYDTIRIEFPSLPAQSVIRIQREAMSMLKSRRSNRHGGALPQKHSLSCVLDKRMYSGLTADGIHISAGTRGKRVHVPFHTYAKADDMFSMYTPMDPTLFFRDGKPYLSVPFELPEKPVTGDTAVGVDLGERQLFVTSEGKSYSDKEYLGTKRRVRKNKRDLQSRSTKAARRRLRRLKRREAC